MIESAPPSSGAWLQTRTLAPGQTHPIVEFLFFPAYIQAVWNRAFPPTDETRQARGADDFDDTERLLLTDTITMDGSSILVRASLIPAPQKPGHFHLRVEAASPKTFRRGGRLILYWDKYEHHVPFRSGEMFFEDISPPDFSRLDKNLPSSRLRLRIEFDEHGDNGKS